jgi:hypothetical protein
MKNLKIFLIFFFLSSFFSCEKEKPLSIVLYNKPPDIIKHYIQGKWRLIYMYGGFGGNEKIIFDTIRFNIEFTTDDRYLYWLNDGPVLADRIITWTKGIDPWVSLDSIWLINFGNQKYSVAKIYSDTLIYHNVLIDSYSYHLIRTN